MFKNVLTVCVGNICRSPTAELLLREKVPGISVSSAGLGALVDRGVEENAAKLLEANGVACDSHKARQLTPAMLYKADLVLVMEPGHVRAVLEMVPEIRGKVFLLGKWADDREVPDPYRKSEEMFAEVYELIDRCCDRWAEFIR